MNKNKDDNQQAVEKQKEHRKSSSVENLLFCSSQQHARFRYPSGLFHTLANPSRESEASVTIYSILAGVI